MNKTNKFLATILAAVFATCSGAIFADDFTDGDIYDMIPVVQVNNTWQLATLPDTRRGFTTADAPVTNRAQRLYFNMELEKRSLTSQNWRLVYTGFGSPTLDEIMDPLKIKIYVSGKPAWASLQGTGSPNGNYTDFIFMYETKTGDFAMPIRLGGSSGPISLVQQDSEYQFVGLSDATHPNGKWAIMDEPKNEATGELHGNYFNPFYRSTPVFPASAAPFGLRKLDYSLSQAGFYVKMCDFDPEWEATDAEHPDDITKNYWRSVHENSSHIGHQSGAARVWANGETEDVVEFYAWSMDETVFRVRSTTQMTIVTGYNTDPVSGEATPLTKSVYYTKVILNKSSLGQSYGEVPLFGVDGGFGRSATLVLSPYPGFTYDASNIRQQDYIEAPVYCSEKEQATLYVSVDPAEVTADGDWENSKAAVCIYVNQDLEADVNPVLQVSFDGDATVSNWVDYVRFSTENSGSLPTPQDSSNALQIAGIRYATTRQFIYMYPVRSDTLTRSPNKVRITATLDAAAQEAAGIRAIAPGATFAIKAANPVVTVTPTSESVESGVPLPLEISVSDIYADVMDTNTGYKVTVNGVTLADSYFYTDEKLQTTNGTLPSVTFANAGENKTVTVKVTSPVSGKSGEGTATVTVRDVTTAVLQLTNESSKFYEGNQIDFQIGFFSGEEQVKLGQNAYAFLYTEDEIDLGKFDADFIITNKEVAASGTAGIRINGSVSTWTQASMMALDGANEAKGGAQYRFQVILCSQRSYDPTKREGLTAYPTSEELNFRVYNVEPTIGGIFVNDSADAYENGSTYTVRVPVGQTRRFRPDITDPGQFDLEATESNEQFKVQWTIYCNGEQWDEDQHIVPGCPVETENISNPTNFYFEFPQAGTWTLRCKVKDKDMSKYTTESCSINVVVLDQPAITITGPEGDETDESRVDETATGSTRFNISTDYFDNKYVTNNGKLTIRLEVGEYGGGATPNAGAIEFATNEYVRLTAPGVYEIELNNNRKIVQLSANRLDGTKFSSTSGFELKATMLTTDILPTPGKTAAEYYLPTTHRVFINNVDPVVQAMEPNSSTNGWTVGKAISWEVLDDVIDDFIGAWADGVTTGVQVKVSGCSNGFVTNVTEATSFEFTPQFSTIPDTYAVLLSIKDKDGVAQTWTYYFEVKASKTLVTRAVGPADGQSALGKRYYLASGIGAGHTYADKARATFVKGEGFSLEWNCARNSAVGVYGFGYKWDEKEGSLDGQSGTYDIAIDWEGNRSDIDTPPAVDAVYHYTSNAVQQSTYAQKFAKGKKESFRYCYLLTERGQGQGATATTMIDNAPDPEIPVAPAKMKTVNLPTEVTGEGSYVETLVEVIFSKEFRRQDNLGDINQDGIPDVYVTKHWRGGKLGSGDPADDMTSLAAANPDGDYLPGVFLGDANATALVAGKTSSWAPIGKPFTAYRELRGLGVGLNDTGTYTYSDPDLTDDEEKAMRNALGLDKDTNITRAHLRRWSPQPSGDFEHLDPTLYDTDGDGYSDGWEYYMWYWAHVTAVANDLKGSRFNADKFYEGDDIEPEEIETQFNPLTARTKDTPADFDNDGLSDYEEYLIGTCPFHWDTDNDQMCDGWEVMNCLNPLANDRDSNADGDYMAYIPYKDGRYIELYGKVYCAVNECSLPDEIPDEGLATRLYPVVSDRTGQPMKYGRMIKIPVTTIPRILSGEVLLPRWGLWVLEPKAVEVYIPAGTEVKRFVIAEEPVAAIHIHDQVYDVRGGFDPRTGWYNNGGLLGSRWTPLKKRRGDDPDDEAGIAVDTAPYLALDEYLVAYYHWHYIVPYQGGYPCQQPSMVMPDRKPPDPAILGTWGWLQEVSTNPAIGEEKISVYTNELGEVVTETNLVASSVSQVLADTLRSAKSNKSLRLTHGADTDGDGAPDGWELYTRRSPCASPNDSDDYPGMLNPDDPGYSGVKAPRDYDDDMLTYVQEFASVDGCNAYRHCETIYQNHPGIKRGWWNKFLPTNPDDPDSDDDYIFDGQEAENFVYGDLGDQGGRCNRGGGLNPWSGDTDYDGLPDLWEIQYHGDLVNLQTHTKIGSPIGKNFSVTTNGEVEPDYVTNSTWIADGVQNIFKKGIYVAGGMDGTWGGDGFTDPFGEQTGVDKDYSIQPVNGVDKNPANSYDPVTGTIRDVDFDHDGLQNWQEYLIQGMRHFRYDDFSTPLMGRMLWPGWQQSFFGFVPFNPHEPLAVNYDLPLRTAMAYFASGEDGIIVETITNGWNVVYNHITGLPTTNYYTRVVTNVATSAKVVNEREAAVDEDNFYFPLDNEGWRKLGYMCLRGVDPVKYPPLLADDAVTAAHISPLVYYGTVSRNYGMTHLYDQMDLEYMPATRAIGSAMQMGQMGRMMPPLIDEEGPQPYWPKRVCAKYVSTDPRKWDTDGDGMSDYYEMFHGLNPLLGSVNGGADIISAAWGSPEGLSARRNPWMFSVFDAAQLKKPNAHTVPEDYPEPNCWDAVMYPWMQGAPEADPDGDGMRNAEEMLYANSTSPNEKHTDPTPRWYTDPTLPMSFVSQYYRWNQLMNEAAYPTHYSASDPWYDTAVRSTKVSKGPDFIYTFEQNEGYDTDNDWIPDGTEIVKTVKVASDPLDATDPQRRQAAWFDGVDSFMMSKSPLYRGGYAADLFKQFTVEAWVCPTRESTTPQTIIERSAVYPGDSINNWGAAVRANFRVGIDGDGRVYGMFDNTDALESGFNQPKSCQILTGQKLPLNQWTHVALTYDGHTLILYVNALRADSAETSLVPANGLLFEQQDITQGLTGAYVMAPSAIFIGARAAHTAEMGDRNKMYDIRTVKYELMREYFAGWIDEVRCWDGARTQAEILENYRKRLTLADASDNRLAVFQSWMNEGTRNDNDAFPTLPAELMMHWTFDNLPGAVNPEDVAKVPAGFKKFVFGAVESTYGGQNPDAQTGLYYDITTSAIDAPQYDAKRNLKGGEEGTYTLGDDNQLECGWWKACATRSLVYDDYSVVPWVENTVNVLPPMDGSVMDDFFYSEQLGGIYTSVTEVGVPKYIFPNSANPYLDLTYATEAGWMYTYYMDRYLRLFHYQNLVSQLHDEKYTLLQKFYQFDVRTRPIGDTDLLPMGHCFAKQCELYWDGAPSDSWEYSRVDDNGNGISDWYEEYARANYFDEVDPGRTINWDTEVNYYGSLMPAYRAFLIDLARGLQPDGDYHPEFVQTADADGDNLPDWWEDLFGVTQYAADDDPDNDGLSNYAEFVLSFGDLIDENSPYGLTKGFPLLNPLSPRSNKDQLVTDYYMPGPDHDIDANGRHVSANEYVGEIVTDHDFMENWWELKFANRYANANVYDPHLDGDGDGWNNYSEVRAYTWRGSFSSDLVDRYLDGEQQSKNYPEPALTLKLTYFGEQDIAGRGLVVRTTSGQMPRTDAVCVIPPSADGQTQGMKFLGGWYEDSKIHGFLSPGSITPGDATFEMAVMSSDKQYIWNYNWYRDNGFETTIHYNSMTPWVGIGTYREFLQQQMQYPHIELEDTTITWEPFAITVSDADGHYGDIIYASSNALSRAMLGSINYRTGEFTLDFGALRSAVGQPLDGSVFRANYAYRIGQNFPQTITVSEATTGRIRQGNNTVEAFIDLDGDGSYTVGEPYGVVQNVQIGWHRVPELVIELKDESPAIARTALKTAAAGAEEAAAPGRTAQYVVRRKTINGLSTIGGKTVPVRLLASKSVVLDDRPYLTESDVLSQGAPDLDWKWLVRDAVKLGIAADDIQNVGFDIEQVSVGTNSEIVYKAVASFVNEFSNTRPAPVTKTPAANAPVYSAQPTFAFACGDETMKAYEIQVATDTNETAVVYDSGILPLPGRTTLAVGQYGFEVSPEIYADCQILKRGDAVLADGSNYYWRVAVFNSKYNKAEESGWSKWTGFQMDTANLNRYPQLPTGYGNLEATVRYFGPARTGDLTNAVVVEVFKTADFTGSPIARKRLASVEKLADAFDISSVDVRMSGIEPGTVFVRAYIDQNDNGKRDEWESWGYANQVGTDFKAIYQPLEVKVTDEINAAAKVVVYIEDCDTNQNEIPDSIEDDQFATSADTPVAGGDIDGDGIADVDEENYGTDQLLWDTDGDRMPDGWEAIFADIDPNFADADEVADGDVMAFALREMTIVAIASTNENAVEIAYILPSGAAVPLVGDDANGLELYNTYRYPVCEAGVYSEYLMRGIKAKLVSAPGAYRVVAVSKGQVALVHAQVYEEFGFNPKTAVAGEGTVNTKPFTALDKYLVCRYLEALGICTETEVNAGGQWSRYTLKPYVLDLDGDGMNDGWELYMMFGPNEMNAATFESGKIISPWNFNDRDLDLDGDGLSLKYEFDRGSNPTDPWAIDSDKDSITDYQAYYYHLKGNDGAKDFDGDGLSNYAEYLISEVYGFAKLDPNNAHTDGTLLDYYRKAGDLYFGEIFTDHDRIPTTFEASARPDYNPYIYDSHIDYDRDGWSNYDEYRAYVAAGTRTQYEVVTNRFPDGSVQSVDTNRSEVTAYEGTPAPYLDLAIRYNGDQTIINTPVKAHVFNGTDLSTPVCSFGATSNEVFYSAGVNYFRGICAVQDGIPMTLKPGKISITAWADLDGDGFYTAGEPYGFVRDVDCGWYGAMAEIELTDTHPVFGRVSMVGAGSASEAIGDATVAVLNDREVIMGADSQNLYFNSFDENGTGGMVEHIRIVRTHINGLSTLSQEMKRAYPKAYRIVYDKYINLPARGNYITEADLLAGGLDIDFDYLMSDMSGMDPTKLTSVHYGIVRGNGDILAGATNIYPVAFARRFDSTQAVARVVRMRDNQNILYGGNPVFEWTIAPLDTYTAFQVQIMKGGTRVWSSGYQPLPPRTADGFYSWTCPVTVGNELANNSSYTWQVQVLNAKFNTIKSDKWSKACAFSTAVNSDQEMNDHDYGSIGVAVRYYGPATVLSKVSATATQGAVLVQAFENPDYTGVPVAAVKVADKATLTAVAPTNNVSVGGLRMEGEYYLRAFIDMNGNGTLEDFEPWGVIEKPITLKTADHTHPVVSLFIEDSDTDGDWLPDAWEYANAGWSGDWATVSALKNASLTEGLVLSEKLSAALSDGSLEASVSTGVPGASLTIFRSGNFAAVLLGLNSSKTATIADIRSAVEGTVVPETVRITSLTVDQAGKKVVLTVGADVAESVAGELFHKLYAYDEGELFATVTVRIYRRETLAEAEWTLVDTVTGTVGSRDAIVEVPFNQALDFSSGFYKVELEQ